MLSQRAESLIGCWPIARGCRPALRVSEDRMCLTCGLATLFATRIGGYAPHRVRAGERCKARVALVTAVRKLSAYEAGAGSGQLDGD